MWTVSRGRVPATCDDQIHAASNLERCRCKSADKPRVPQLLGAWPRQSLTQLKGMVSLAETQLQGPLTPIICSNLIMN